MDVTATLDAACHARRAVPLGRFARQLHRWLEIVPRTEPAPAADGDPARPGSSTCGAGSGRWPGPSACAWSAPSTDAPERAVFERRETDGRDHAAWVLRRRRSPTPARVPRTAVTMDLHYGGSLWVPLLDRLLAGEIEASRQRLRGRWSAG